MKRSIFLLWGLLISGAVFAQQDSVLMRINGKQVFRSEFESSYRRHCLKNKVKLSPQKFLDIFINYQLKVDAAEKASLDTTFTFQNQLNEFRSGFCDSYRLERSVGDPLAYQIYTRQKERSKGGQVFVAQIFRSLSQTVSPHKLHQEERLMDSIYRQIQEHPDIDFSIWVNRYSDDKKSKWILPLQTTAELEEQIYSLKVGEISKPFASPEGLHILKVVDKKEIPAYDQLRNTLIDRIVGNNSANKVTETIVETYKKEYQYIPDNQAFEELLTAGTTDRVLFTIAGKAYDGKLFQDFSKAHPEAIEKQLKGFVAKSLLDYAYVNSVEKEPDWRQKYSEFRNGLLVSSITEMKVNTPAETDTIGISTFFNLHSSNYRWKSPRFEGILLHCATKKIAKEVKRVLKRNPEEKWKEFIQQSFDSSKVDLAKIEQNTFALGQNVFIDKLVFKTGEMPKMESYPFTVAIGKKIKKPSSYKMVSELVVSDYKKYLETLWMKRLQADSKVEINQEVLKTVNNI